MKRTFGIYVALVVGLTACGGGEPAADAGGSGGAPAAEPSGAPGALTMPDWYRYDEGGNTVTLDITAGMTSDLNYWNYNGYTNGAATIVVPVGATVTINFTNQDPIMAHSIGVASFTSSPPAALNATPAIEGAISSNPTSMTESTLSGQSESFTFTAAQAGDFSLACYTPGHAVAGMWVGFTVSDSGEAGMRQN